jgi:hypothetical protein
MKTLRMAIAGLVCLAALAATGQDTSGAKKKASGKKAAHADQHVAIAPADVKWGDPPPVFPKGAKFAVLDGDPGKPGPFTVRLQAPDGYKVMPHWHPTTERITVLSGEFHIGMSDSVDATKETTLPAGGYLALPAHMHHYAWVKGETVLQINSTGPFALYYINPADDPSGMQGKKKASKSAKTAK